MKEGKDLFADARVVNVDREERVGDIDVVADAVVAKPLRRSVLVQHVVRQIADDLERVDDYWFRCRGYNILFA